MFIICITIQLFKGGCSSYKINAFSHNAYFSLEVEEEEFMRQIDELKENSTKKDCKIDQLNSNLAKIKNIAHEPMVRIIIRKASWMAIMSSKHLNNFSFT